MITRDKGDMADTLSLRFNFILERLVGVSVWVGSIVVSLFSCVTLKYTLQFLALLRRVFERGTRQEDF